MERVSANHPNVCQGTLNSGRCPYRAKEGAQFCDLHGGAASHAAFKRQRLRNYLIETTHGQRATQLANSEHLKDLTDEVALVRVLLESVFQQIANHNDVLMFSDRVIALTSTIRGLIESLQKIQERNRELIDRQSLLTLADAIIAVITQHVQDPDVRVAIANEIVTCVVATMGEKVDPV